MLLGDVKHAFRVFRQAPAFTVTAITALALGIGANTAIFSVVNTVLLRPLPYPNADRMVELRLAFPQGGQDVISIPDLVAMRELTEALQEVAAYDYSGPGINLTGGDLPVQVKGVHVSAEYFRLFGAPVALGRSFTPEEDHPGGGNFVVISDALWHSRFGADRSIVGRSISLGGAPYLVVGVIGAAFEPIRPADLWLPLQLDPNNTSQAHYLLGAARLGPGISVDQAKAQLKIATDRYRQKYPLFNPQVSLSVELLRDAVVSNVRTALLILLGAVCFVLLIACANVANLLLARATGRRREIAIRAALGAARADIVRQLLTESLLLSIAGGIVGLGLGYAAVRALLSFYSGNIPRIGEHGAAVSLDWRVLAFTVGVSIVTGILFGLIPALNASRADLNAMISESGPRSGSGLRQNKAQALLVISEVALALVLLAGATLLIRTFAALRSVNPGFDSHNILAMEMSLAGPAFEKTSSVARLVRDARERIGALPGVEAVASTPSVPLEPSFGLPFDIEGRPQATNQSGGWRSVSVGYFEVFHIPMRRGRLFTARDEGSAPRVVLINEAMAKRYWPQGDPVGQRITIGGGLGPDFADPPRQILGIVGDVRELGLSRDPVPVMYIPVSQVPDGMTRLGNRLIPITWAIRTRVAPYSLSGPIQEQLRQASGGLPVSKIRSMDQVVTESTARSDFNTIVLGTFAGIALMLASIGIYGLMSYAVEQRTQEIGIRLALGAAPEQVRNMIVFGGMRLALVGVVLGIAAAFGLTRFMASLIYGVKTSDPLVLTAGASVVTAVALVATFIPARRATRIDPAEALRYE
jgi:putative ABC transport system permease protein